MALAVKPIPNVPDMSLESYKMDIVSCDRNVFESNRSPMEAIRSLYFNAYTHLIQILSPFLSGIKLVALDAVRMQQVPATEAEVKRSHKLRTLFGYLEVDKNWNDINFLDIAIRSLPPKATREKEAAQLVLNQYKSYLRAYTKAVSIKEGKRVFGGLRRKQGREEKMVVTEITVDKEIDEYTCKDCLELWTWFLIDALEIPEDHIRFCGARSCNSTTLVFVVAQTFTGGMKVNLSKPNTVWVMKELSILRVHIVGVFKLDLRLVLPNLPIASIREGLETGVDFMSLTKVCVCACVH